MFLDDCPILVTASILDILFLFAAFHTGCYDAV